MGPFERVIAPGAEAAVANVKPLPAGTRIWSNLFVMCRSEQIFGNDVNDFRPERWLESSQEMLRGMEDMYCVFGRGSRRCIGQELAWMILEKTLVAVSAIPPPLWWMRNDRLTRPQVVKKWNLHCSQEALKGRALFEMQFDELVMTLTPRTEELQTEKH